MTLFWLKASTAWALGVRNLWRVLLYRAMLALGLSSVQRLQCVTPEGPFFRPVARSSLSCVATTNWRNAARLFGYLDYPIGESTPRWHESPLSHVSVSSPGRDWWTIPDFDPAVGDIKAIWELSRFDWVLAFAQWARQGDADALLRLNTWLDDWSAKNPPLKGPNWKCGQEASIRVMHLAMAAVVLDQIGQPLPGLMDFVALHLRRIAPTMQYAIAQDNNHGTSEAAALFIGGSWLAQQRRPEGVPWQRMGRKWLEERASRLIGQDGSFSQYSLNYHRVMLDTLSMAEIWRRKLSLPPFSAVYGQRLKAATAWLYAMVDPVTGDGPNLGANDGARLLVLTDTDYRDYRPSVQLATVLFTDMRAYAGDGAWNWPLCWLGINIPEQVAQAPVSMLFDDGGFAALRRRGIMVLLRYPRFRFRPSHADALHVDLWQDGQNLLRDAGTYSYNTDPQWLRYFPGTESHNTVQFDDRDQMPRLGRFLFGGWLRTCDIEPLRDDDVSVSFGVMYQDGEQAQHRRRLTLDDSSLVIEDQVMGFAEKAVLRWRLQPGDWQIDGHAVRKGSHVLSISTSVELSRFELVEGWESRYYLQKTVVPVLEVEVREPALIRSQYQWSGVDEVVNMLKSKERGMKC